MSMDKEEGGQGQGRFVPDWTRGVNKDQAGPPAKISFWRNPMNFGKLRPQIFLSIICLSVLAIVGVWQGYSEIATATIGGIIALGMKVLENE